MGLSPWYFEAFLTSMGAMNNAAAIPSHCFSTHKPELIMKKKTSVDWKQ